MNGPALDVTRADTDTTVDAARRRLQRAHVDPRGFGGSGGNVESDSAAVEGRAPGRNGFRRPQQDPQIRQTFVDTLARGSMTDDEKASRGPRTGRNIAKIRIPTLISRAPTTRCSRCARGSPTTSPARGRDAGRDDLVCGGLTDPSIAHGICLDGTGPDPGSCSSSRSSGSTATLRGNHNVDTGPGFRWLSDAGVLHGAAAYPPPRGAPLTGSGSGTLAMVAGDTSGLLVAATKAVNAVNVDLAKPANGTQLLGAPSVTLSYSALRPRPTRASTVS